jgi:antitoxin VapB
MSLNIKNPRTHQLARDLAALTGESVTDAVTVALQERLERLERQQNEKWLVERALEIGRDCAARLGPYRHVDHGELLYDERGLPR